MIGTGLSRRTLLAALASTPVAARAARKMLYRDDFSHGLDQWLLEAASPQARVSAAQGVLREMSLRQVRSSRLISPSEMTPA